MSGRLLAGLLLCLAALPLQARDLLIVLDGSNSMWGQIDGQAKVVLAREALGGLIDGLADDDQVGLIAYGHRREADCADVELVQPVGPLNRSQFKQRIEGVNPRGKTPIHASMQMAFEAIANASGPTSIILVSDGIETCDADPCATVAAARAGGLDFNLQVVGFEVDDEASSQLACMAEAGGGRFLTADNADELVLAIEQAGGVQARAGLVSELQGRASIERDGETLQQVAVEDAVFVEDQLRTEANSLLAVTLEDGSRIDLDEEALLVLAEYVSGPQAQSLMQLTRGRLRARVGQAFSQSPGSFSVNTPNAVMGVQGTDFGVRSEADTTSVFVYEGVVSLEHINPAIPGVVTLRAGDFSRVLGNQPPTPVSQPQLALSVSLNGNPVDASLTVEIGSREVASGNAPLSVSIEPGPVQVTATLDDGSTQTDAIDVPIDGLEHTVDIRQLSASLEAPDEAGQGSRIQVTWQGPDQPRDYIGVVPRGSNWVAGANYTYTSMGSPLSLTLPAETGDFDLVYVVNEGREVIGRRPIVLTAASASLSAAAEAGQGSQLSVEWQGPDNVRDFIGVVPRGSNWVARANYTYTSMGNPLSLTLPAETGDFDLVYVLNEGREVIARQPITLTAAAATLTAADEAGQGSQLSIEWQGPDNVRDFIGVVPRGSNWVAGANYTYTGQGNPLTLTLPAETGDFDLVYVLNEGREIIARKPITLSAASASLSAADEAGQGSQLSVQWQGPDNVRDFIGVVPRGSNWISGANYTYTSQGNPITLNLPPDPGDYDLVYVLNEGREVIARKPLTIIESQAALDAPASASEGSVLAVQWQGPDNLRDFVGVVPRGSNWVSGANYTYVSQGNPLNLNIPVGSGEFDLVYVLNQGRQVIARRPLSITAAQASLEAPASATAGTTLAVDWQGPGNRGDVISIVPKGAEWRGQLGNVNTSRGNPAQLRLPEEPGEYELVYVLYQGRTIIERKPIRLTPP